MVLAAVAFASVAAPASAALVIELDYEFSGATAPSGTPPWLRATFTTVEPGKVDLLLEAVNLSATEFVAGWYFNLDSSLDPTKLGFVFGDKTGSFDYPTPSTDVNEFKADGDGFFDILFKFEVAGGPGDKRFGKGDSLP